MKKDILLTYITEFAVLLCGLLVYRFAAEQLKEEGFALYAVIRRNISFIFPILLLGTAVGLPRFIALEGSVNNHKSGYLLSGLILVTSVSFLYLLLTFIFKQQFIILLFGTDKFSFLFFPFNIFLFGLLLHSILYSYFRGVFRMGYANIIQFINMCIIPVMSFIFHDISFILIFNGSALILISLAVLIYQFRQLKWEFSSIRNTGKSILVYGIQRVPGDISMSALFALPAIFSSHLTGIKEAGYIAFGISLVGMVGACFSPISIIALPVAGQMMVEKKYIVLKKYIVKILFVVTIIATGGIVVFELFSKTILELYLGFSNPDLVITTQWLIFCGIGYAIYVCMRSFIDTIYTTGINALNQVLSLGLMCIIGYLVFTYRINSFWLVYGFVLAVLLLGILTAIRAFIILNILQKKHAGRN